MSSSFKVITPVATELISLSEAKSWLRVDWPDDDALIGLLITRARAFAETVTHRALGTQVIQQVDTIERPAGGELSGPINKGPSWYQYQEQLGANPFGAAQFYFDLAMPPVQASIPIVAETKVIAFDPWTVFAQFTNPDNSTNTYLDDNREPARFYFESPVTANFWRFTFTTGYDGVTYILPPDIKQAILESISFFYDHREADDLPDPIMSKLLARRVDWL